MSKRSAEMAHLVRSPKAMMEYQMTGKTPSAVQPSSPLITFLSSLSPRERQQMTCVRLSPQLGYQTGAQFHTAEAMLRYLKPSEWVVGNWPAESFRIKQFNKTITREDFMAAQQR